MSSRKILGIDVGGTKIAAGLVDVKGAISEYRLFMTSQANLMRQLFDIIAGYQNFSKISLGMPGQVTGNGEVVSLPNVRKFKRTNIKTLLKNRFRVPVTVYNDAKCFAYAEAINGAGKNFSSVVGVTLGTGIGVGIVFNKHLYVGRDGLAGEVGQFPMIEGKSFESYVKHAGIFKNATKASLYLNLLLSYLILAYNPDVIVLGGGWSKISGMMRITKLILSRLGFRTTTKVALSKLEHPALLGAALLALKK